MNARLVLGVVADIDVRLQGLRHRGIAIGHFILVLVHLLLSVDALHEVLVEVPEELQRDVLAEGVHLEVRWFELEGDVLLPEVFSEVLVIDSLVPLLAFQKVYRLLHDLSQKDICFLNVVGELPNLLPALRFKILQLPLLRIQRNLLLHRLLLY